MPYVKREGGVVVALYKNEQDGITEYLENSDPEVIAYRNPPPPTNDEVYDAVMNSNQLIKAIVISINDGTLVTGANLTGTQVKAIIKANM